MPNQAVDYRVITGVEGMEEFTALINRVGSLEKEMNRFKRAVNGVVGPMQQQKRGLQQSTKEARLAQIGTQQLGMQFNDLATSISAGMNPMMAMQQQVGQMGYAMTQMGGKFSKVGSFIAGPWGAALLMASMLLGNLFGDTEDVTDAIEDFDDAIQPTIEGVEQLTEANRILADANAEVTRTTRQGIISTRQMAEAAKAAASAKLTEAEADLARFRAARNFNQSGVTGAEAAAMGFSQGGLRNAEQEVQALETRMAELRQTIAGSTFDLRTMEAGMSASEIQIDNLRGAVTGLRQAYMASEGTNETVLQQALALESQIRELEDAQRGAGRGARSHRKELTDLEVAMARLDIQAGALTRAYEQGNLTRAQYTAGAVELWTTMRLTERAHRSNTEVIEEQAERYFELQEAARKAREELSRSLAEGTEPLITEMDIPDISGIIEDNLIRARDAMRGYTDEMKRSFDAVGESVSNSFKGMLTGAMGWKDAMRGIIQSVIDELWRMYVVQQIVGMVTGFLGSLGLPKVGGRASGGSVKEGKPYIVGERGPELFMPGQSGTIVPNHMTDKVTGGGGGVTLNVSVDARGATDPAMVDARVRQGIMEAAPALIKASQAQTVQGITRRKLGGSIR